ncbi:LD-carboxypeptidase [Massilia sp. BSC265]|uniref:S66 peptidase family protein n=1 Tax=Massilia sp. BSC265 TaxID=1549812 RepID=UPI0004E951EA|nr:LD-carboxypeptidase [Massilia sp. BSC265]KFI05329.1 murein peptide carboxypeptidase YkfA [Massilia sp. BSC265]
MTLSRRSFGALVAAGFSASGLAAAAPQRSPKRLIKPPRLRPGDLVGLIAPGGFADDRLIEKAVQNIEALGMRAKVGTYIKAVHGNYAGSSQQRLADLHAMFADPEVKMIWPIRGGSGCISLLSKLDYGLIRRNPKILLGYSDITALHLAIYNRTGLVTFHGPVASSTLADYPREHMMAVLTDPRPSYTIPMAPENALKAHTAPHFGIRTLTAGVATGPLLGGNLSIVAALCGTPYAADFSKALLFLEEVDEAPYRLDRWMTQLDLSFGFANAAGVMVGICEDCAPQEGRRSLSLDETFDQHLKPLTVPAVTGYSIGHIRHQFTIPVGVRGRLDTEAQTVTLLEPAVS